MCMPGAYRGQKMVSGLPEAKMMAIVSHHVGAENWLCILVVNPWVLSSSSINLVLCLKILEKEEQIKYKVSEWKDSKD